MFSGALRNYLDLYPKGVSSQQLLFHLRTSGVRVTAEEVTQCLQTLTESGEVFFANNRRWVSRKFSQNPLSRGTPSPPAASPGSPPLVLQAVRATRLINGAAAPESEACSDDSEAPSAMLPDWRTLLRYYAATQRADPRGAVTEFADRHGEAWQLVAANGAWWRGSASFPLSSAPETFREALSRRKELVCALGYAISVFATPAGNELVPALLVAATWRFEGEFLVVMADTQDPVLNPDWLKGVEARSKWTRAALAEVLQPDGEESSLDAISTRLRRALASLGAEALSPGELSQSLQIDKEGIFNCAAIYLPSDARFTQGAAADIESIAAWPEMTFSGSALARLLANAPVQSEEGAEPLLVPQRELTDRQFQAAVAALRHPLTVIQGPPGTGKSEVIVALLVSLFLARKSVLFASKNHQALDEVEGRLRVLFGDAPVATRARDADGERDNSFLSVLKSLARSEPRGVARAPNLSALLDAARAQMRIRRARLRRAQIELELAAILDVAIAAEVEIDAKVRLGVLARLKSFLARFRRPTPTTPHDLSSPGALSARVRQLKAERRVLEDEAAPLEATSPLAEAAALAAYAEFSTTVTPSERETLVDVAQRLDFSGASSSRKLGPGDAAILLRRRPIWMTSTLSAPARMPLLSGLFDFVIVDEAGQCDIASTLPLLARAKQSVFVGDPQQLAFIPSLSLAREHALMNNIALPRENRHRYAQSRVSMFDFAAGRPGRREFFLADQFRSAEAIVSYLNDEFYRGRLVCRRDGETLKTPDGYRPGLTWRHVAGQVRREDGGNVNVEEAQAAAALAVELVRTAGFDGTIGVISPFQAQVGRISRLVSERLTSAEKARGTVRVATVDKFQGGEADVILFSPVVAPGADFSATNFLRRERRRFNVAISRARALCIVIGDLEYALKSDIAHYRSLARHATTPFSPPRSGFDSMWERRLDAAMRTRGWEPHSQYPVGTKYLDFALFHGDLKLDVEVDGRAFHADRDGNRKVADLLRDRELTARGWNVLRFWVSELHEDMEGCLDRIAGEFR